MTVPVRTEKNELRQLYRERRLSLGADEKASRDGAICRAAVSLASYRFSKNVLLYAPTDEEIDVMPIALDALSKGKRVAFPRCNAENRTMKYRVVSSLDELESGYSGILEPPESAPALEAEEDFASSICFVPALVYDTKGYRLGYGKGFYDRFLYSFGGNAVGVVYSDFITDGVPRGRYDVQIKILLTEKGVIVTGEN